jgi:hypothetical protein
LFGLSNALSAQGKKDESLQLRKEFEGVWQYADITLNRSAF